ncbi:MFS transporter [Alkalicoccobacillus plakortidis]|uniref:MFS transporter n=1 Tax=Alkalicoccobacillus plakortidis TaxID=444060 RepID=A0ABT0XP87_9BACI|nr:MFS transporter [Alkalicoccobacillus plakortidis]MCM2677069.1 MFS transporter [Alkalicoccobacillus plakortidis]
MTEVAYTLRKNHAFYWLMGGNLVSFAGAQVYLIALPLVVLALTGSTIAMGTVAALGHATVWLQPLLGPVVDRYSRKTLLLLCDFVRAFVLLVLSGLYLVDELHIIYLFIAALIIGTCTQLYNTAQFAVIPSIVKKDDLQLANTIESSMFHTLFWSGQHLADF